MENDGLRKLSEKNLKDYNPNTNFNLWNFDLSYDWEFAPEVKLHFFTEIIFLMKIIYLEFLITKAIKISSKIQLITNYH